MEVMGAPPLSLPPAGSPKWHGRRLWDSLGYFRVRTLANPKWKPDAARVARMLGAERQAAPGHQRELIDRALDAARQYAKLTKRRETASSPTRPEATWDQVLVAIDEILEFRQREHLRAVDHASRSGRRAPMPADPATGDGAAT